MWELMYTSAPGGLKPGSRGFCTVAMTRGLGLNLVQRLESLSGYRPAYPPHDPRSRENPVNISYCDFRLGGERYFVLSRLAFAGFDYTQRSNKIAHHVVLTADELPLEGPAWLALQEGVFETTWSGEPRLLPERESAPHSPRPLRPARHWQETVGDAGWAGILAERLLEEPPVPTAMLFQPGMPVIQLVDEAMALLPPEARWETNFSTYQTDVPAGVTYQWRALLPDSPLLGEVRRNRRLVVLDLTHSLEMASGAHLVECARTGVDPWPRPDIPSETHAPQAELPAPSQPVGHPVRRPGPQSPVPRPIALEAKYEEPQRDQPQANLKIPRHVLEMNRRRKRRRTLLIALSVAAIAVVTALSLRVVLPTADSRGKAEEHDQAVVGAPPREKAPEPESEVRKEPRENDPDDTPAPGPEGTNEGATQPVGNAPNAEHAIQAKDVPMNAGQDENPKSEAPKSDAPPDPPPQPHVADLERVELGLYPHARTRDLGEPIESILIPLSDDGIGLASSNAADGLYTVKVPDQLGVNEAKITIKREGNHVELVKILRLDKKKKEKESERLEESHEDDLVHFSDSDTKPFRLKGADDRDLGYLVFLTYDYGKAYKAAREKRDVVKGRLKEVDEETEAILALRGDVDKELWKARESLRGSLHGTKLRGFLALLKVDVLASSDKSILEEGVTIVLTLAQDRTRNPKISVLDYPKTRDWEDKGSKWQKITGILKSAAKEDLSDSQSLMLEGARVLIERLMKRREEYEKTRTTLEKLEDDKQRIEGDINGIEREMSELEDEEEAHRGL